MQEPLIKRYGLSCDYCGKESKDHNWWQVWIPCDENRQVLIDKYICTKCYKQIKDKEIG